MDIHILRRLKLRSINIKRLYHVATILEYSLLKLVSSATTHQVDSCNLTSAQLAWPKTASNTSLLSTSEKHYLHKFYTSSSLTHPLTLFIYLLQAVPVTTRPTAAGRWWHVRACPRPPGPRWRRPRPDRRRRPRTARADASPAPRGSTACPCPPASTRTFLQPFYRLRLLS